MPWRCRPRQILETQWHSAVVEALKVHANAVGPNLPWLPISPQVLAIPARVIRPFTYAAPRPASACAPAGRVGRGAS
jgi:hypothetical protein